MFNRKLGLVILLTLVLFSSVVCGIGDVFGSTVRSAEGYQPGWLLLEGRTYHTRDEVVGSILEDGQIAALYAYSAEGNSFDIVNVMVDRGNLEIIKKDEDKGRVLGNKVIFYPQPDAVLSFTGQGDSVEITEAVNVEIDAGRRPEYQAPISLQVGDRFAVDLPNGAAHCQFEVITEVPGIQKLCGVEELTVQANLVRYHRGLGPAGIGPDELVHYQQTREGVILSDANYRVYMR